MLVLVLVLVLVFVLLLLLLVLVLSQLTITSTKGAYEGMASILECFRKALRVQLTSGAWTLRVRHKSRVSGLLV